MKDTVCVHEFRDIGVQMCERMAEIRIAPSKSKEGYIKKLCYDIEKYRALVDVFRDAYKNLSKKTTDALASWMNCLRVKYK